MKSLPVLFSPVMVRKLLSNEKWMTRRLEDSPLAKAEPGDLLWVKETWAIADCPRRISTQAEAWPDGYPMDRLRYYATDVPPVKGSWWIKRPSMFMPRWASRITLEVTEKRFERLQFISDQDVIAEGATTDLPFGAIWAGLHTKPGTRWEENPMVCVLSFKCHKINIDEFIKEKGIAA